MILEGFMLAIFSILDGFTLALFSTFGWIYTVFLMFMALYWLLLVVLDRFILSVFIAF